MDRLPFIRHKNHPFPARHYVLTRFRQGLFTPKQVAGNVAAKVTPCRECLREKPPPLLARSQYLK